MDDGMMDDGDFEDVGMMDDSDFNDVWMMGDVGDVGKRARARSWKI
ncbi:hypothetical protein ES703_114177 [subsurface metagenome]